MEGLDLIMQRSSGMKILFFIIFFYLLFFAFVMSYACNLNETQVDDTEDEEIEITHEDCLKIGDMTIYKSSKKAKYFEDEKN